MSDWIGETFTSNRGWAHLEDLVDIGNRMAGSDGETQAAQATKTSFDAAGARETSIDTFDIQGWTRGTAQIRTPKTAFDCIALPRSPSETVEGPLVDLGYGLPEDFDQDLTGAVVLVASDIPDWYDRFIHRREKYYRAVNAGAAAFIFQNHIPGCLPPTGSVGTADQPIGDIPAVGVSKEVGSKLSRVADSDPVTVSVEADIHDATSQNVHAHIGPDTDTELLVTSHIDAHDIAEGASDNAGGTALTVEVANALRNHDTDVDTSVHLIAFGAEEVGLCGSQYDSHARVLANLKAIINIDGALRGRTLKIHTHGFDAFSPLIKSVSGRFDHPIQTSPGLSPHSDHWPYVAHGVPGLQVSSQTEGEGRGWGHTAADTLDKLEPRTLREQAILLTELVTVIADADVQIEHREPSAIATQLEDEDLAEGMQITGDWPYS